MNILILSPFLPYPLSQGGKIRVFNIIRYLSRKHSITLGCLTEKETRNYGPLSEMCGEIVCVEKRADPVGDLLVFLLTGRPFNYVRFSSGAFRKALQLLLRKRRFDLVHIEFSLMWQHANMFAGTPAVLGEQNLEFEIVRQIGAAQGNPLRRLLYLLEEKRLRRKEEEAWRECDLCFAVSERERNFIAAHVGDPGKVFTVPNGVDLERFGYGPKPCSENRLLFIGGLDYFPNLASAQYLLLDIFPLIRSKMPQAKLDIVGRDLGRIAGAASVGGIALHEDVPDVLPYFRKADVLLVPLRAGAGTRIKILEAMAAGLPVVSTSKGCEGLDVKDGKHLLIADEPESFASAIERLLSDDALRAALVRNARALVEESYSWEKIVGEMEKQYLKIRE